jgi:hypothetical protein
VSAHLINSAEPLRFPVENDAAAPRVELSPAAIASPPNLTIIAIGDSKFGDDRERPVKIILSQTQAVHLAKRLAAVIAHARRAGA